jgi:hypothetical protein
MVHFASLGRLIREMDHSVESELAGEAEVLREELPPLLSPP